MHRFIEYSDPDTQVDRHTLAVGAKLAGALARKDQATLAVSGGTTTCSFPERLSFLGVEETSDCKAVVRSAVEWAAQGAASPRYTSFKLPPGTEALTIHFTEGARQ